MLGASFRRAGTRRIKDPARAKMTARAALHHDISRVGQHPFLRVPRVSTSLVTEHFGKRRHHAFADAPAPPQAAWYSVHIPWPAKGLLS